MEISCLRTSKLFKNELGGILDIFCNYLNVIKVFFPLFLGACNPKLHLAYWAQKEFSLKGYQKWVRIKHQNVLFTHFETV